MTAPLLEISNVTKIYGDCVSNDGISLTVAPGSIHALIGENGAGKSTLMRMLFGMETPTSGHFKWRGKDIQFKSPQAAKNAGIGMVHQHFMQAEHMTALDHLALEMSARSGFWHKLRAIPWNSLRAEAKDLAARYQMKIPWDKEVCDLSVIEQQRLEILKLLSQDAELLILDEPTAVLSPIEVTPFLERLTALKKAGKSILLISHKLKEVTAVADDVSVLRRGKLVWTGPVAGKTEHELAGLMVGGDFDPNTSRPSAPPPSDGGTCLAVELREVRRTDGTAPLFRGLSFEVRSHEILGFAGVEGNGQSEIAELMLFPQNFEGDGDSAVRLTDQQGESVNLLGLSPAEIRGRGVAWVPPDRHQQAVILPMSASVNLAVGHQNSPRYSHWGLMNWRRTSRDFTKLIQDFDVRPAAGDLRMREYSGGNQQKIVIGREYASSPRLLIAEHPTRGVDLAASVKIHDAFRDLKSRGSAVILISADLDELTRTCDRILVFYRHQIQAEFRACTNDRAYDLADIGRAMAGLA